MAYFLTIEESKLNGKRGFLFKRTNDTKLVSDKKYYQTLDGEEKLLEELERRTSPILEDYNSSTNINIICKFFPNLFGKLLLRVFESDKNKNNSNLIDMWKKSFINSKSKREYSTVSFTVELDFLQMLLNLSIEKTKSNGNYDKELITNEKKSLRETSTGNRTRLLSSINITPQILFKISANLGKEYETEKMVSSETNDRDIFRIKVHNIIFEVLKLYGYKYSVDSLKKIGLTSLKKILESKSETPNYTNLENDQIKAGILLGIIPNNSKYSTFFTEEEAEKIPIQGPKTIHQILKERFIPLFSNINLRAVYEGKIAFDEIKESKENFSPFSRILPFLNDVVLPTKELSESSETKAEFIVAKIIYLLDEKQVTDKPLNKLPNLLSSLLLSSSEYKRLENLEATIIKKQNQQTLRLYEWQSNFVKMIHRGESVIAIGPTSGGKTLASMSALDLLFRNNTDEIIFYTAPNFYQTFQAYMNIVKTFKDKTIGIISTSINITPNNCKVWIGTAPELYIFALSRGLYHNIIICDEIHTISTSYGSDQIESNERALALKNLISRTKNPSSTKKGQFIGLSATIHDEDIQPLCDKMEFYMNKKVDPVQEKPLKTNLVEVADESSSDSNYKSVFNTLEEILENDNYIKDYAKWIELQSEFNEQIEKFNSSLKSITISPTSNRSNQNKPQKKRSTHSTKDAKDAKDAKATKDSYGSLLVSIKSAISDSIKELIEIEDQKMTTDDWDYKEGDIIEVSPKVSTSDFDQEEIKLLSEFYPEKIPEFINYVIFDFFMEYIKFNRLPKNFVRIPTLCEGVGSFFKIKKTRAKSSTSQYLTEEKESKNKSKHSSSAIKLSEPINYSNIGRRVPLIDCYWDGSDINMVDQKKSQDLILEHVEVTPEETFKLLKLITNKDGKCLTPALVFDTLEEISFDYFKQLVIYLDNRYKREYHLWIIIQNKWETELTELNHSIESYENSVSGPQVEYKETQDWSRRSRSKKQNKVQGVSVSHSGNWELLYNRRIKCINKIKSELKSAIISPFENGSINTNIFDKEQIQKFTSLFSEVESSENKDETPTKTITPPNLITPLIYDLFMEYIKFDTLKEALKSVPIVCEGIGTYFKVGKGQYSSVFKDLLVPTIKTHEESDLMCDLSNAEGSGVEEVKNILYLMDKALLFGFGILLPNIPFSVQYQVLKMLDTKKLDIVFVSKSMSMGVNYPAKTCIIRCPNLEQINICEVIQMKGRAGRFGLISDKEAYAITWNIKNPDKTSVNYMPRIVFPAEEELVDFMLTDHNLDYADSLIDLMVKEDNFEDLKNASQHVNLHKKFNTASSIQYEGDEEDEVDEEGEKEDTKEILYPVKAKLPFTASTLLNDVQDSINKCIDKIFDSNYESLEDIKLHISAIYDNFVPDPNIFYNNSYEWAEKINKVKYKLQKLHTFIHGRKCTKLLEYIKFLYRLIHGISLKYIGFALKIN
jgi:hypothetical protein